MMMLAALLMIAWTVPLSLQVETPRVRARAQTALVGIDGDAADDPAIWRNPRSPEESLIIGTNKKAGLETYDLSGGRVQQLLDGYMNNVEVVAGVAGSKGSVPVDLVIASNRSDNAIWAYVVNPDSRQLEKLIGAPFVTGLHEVYGLCAYLDPTTRGCMVVIGSKAGLIRVCSLKLQDAGIWRADAIREFHVGGQAEGFVADPEHAALYIGEETLGVWRYPLATSADTPRRLLDVVHGSGPGPSGQLSPDVEGVTLYSMPGGGGWVLVSCQGDNRIAAYDRQSGRYRGSFGVVLDQDGSKLDPVTHTDGLAASSESFGSAFPKGLLVLQDDNDGGRQNFKIVDWRAIEAVLGDAAVTQTPAERP